MYKHEHGEDNEVQTGQGFGQALVVSSQPPEWVEPAEAALDYPAARQQHKALLRLWQVDNLQFNAFVTRGLCSRLAGIALVGECKFHRLTGCLLNLACKLGYLHTLLLVGRRDMHREQQAQRVDSHMNFAASLALITVVTRTRTAFACGLQRA